VIGIIDNSATALILQQGVANTYITLSTADDAEAISFGWTTATDNAPEANIIQTGQGGYAAFSGIDHGPRLVLVETFERRPEVNANIANDTANKVWELETIVNVPTSTLAAGGGVVITTAGAANDGAAVIPHQDANQSAWNAITWSSSEQIIGKFNFFPDNVTAVRIECGFRTTTGAMDDATDNDKLILRFDSTDGATSNTNWVLVTSATGADTTSDTGVAAAASAIRVVFTVDASFQVRCYINSLLQNDPTANVLTAATAQGLPYAGILQTGVNARAMDVQRITASRTY